MKIQIPLIIIALLLAACSPADNTSTECSSDSDCVPASCCHSNSCVPEEKAPVCKGIFCTQECVPGTLDCSQGSCMCIEGICTAVFE